MSDKKEQAAANVAALLVMCGSLVVTFLLWGWAGSVLWAWFVVPLGAAEISMWHAAGLRVLVSLVTSRKRGDGAERDNLTAALEGFAAAVLIPLLALGFGWVAKAFM
jgi:hypothetical protein